MNPDEQRTVSFTTIRTRWEKDVCVMKLYFEANYDYSEGSGELSIRRYLDNFWPEFVHGVPLKECVGVDDPYVNICPPHRIRRFVVVSITGNQRELLNNYFMQRGAAMNNGM